MVGEIQPAELAHPGRDNKVADQSPADLSTAYKQSFTVSHYRVCYYKDSAFVRAPSHTMGGQDSSSALPSLSVRPAAKAVFYFYFFCER